MNTQLTALLAAELDSLCGPARLERAAELLRTMAESFRDPSSYRAWLENCAADFEADAEQRREADEAAHQEHEHAMRNSPRYRRAFAEGAV